MRSVCIHGHFYQPPRENAWTEVVDAQPGAAPFHDWNARITAECYRPNTAAAVLDEEGEVREVVSNYERMSFDFGPTLLSWLERSDPDTYAAVLRSDAASMARFGGHGSAMAQGYNHTILPLSNARDRRTQVVWGVRDFAHRFRRRPAGMWLPECAASTGVLEALAEEGIRFTVLGAHQLRPEEAHAADLRPIDHTRPWLIPLPSGRWIAAFAYDGPLSQAIAFSNLLESGEELAKRLATALPDGLEAPRLESVATDGETYGHHHRFGDMALAYALLRLERARDVRLTNFAQALAEHPPRGVARLVEDTSWSCAHGVERWRSGCGCSTGGNPGFHQEWRAPLRAALDALRDELDPLFEREAARFVHDPWAARDDAIELVLDRAPGVEAAFYERHARAALTPDARAHVRALLEMERQAQLMFTSCAWFFDDVGGIETLQVLQYAARAVELARQTTGAHLEPGLVERLRLARSNRPDVGDAAAVYAEAKQGRDGGTAATGAARSGTEPA